MHPVLTEYLLKLDITSPPHDFNFGLPAKDLLSSAVRPPARTQILTHKRCHQQNPGVQLSDKWSGVGVTVEDVLKIVGANPRLSPSHRKWSDQGDDGRRDVEAAFEDRGRAEDERGGDIRHIDYLGGRNRLQIFHQALTL